LAGLGAWLGKPEGLAARSSIINISKYLQHVNGLSTTGWGAFFMSKARRKEVIKEQRNFPRGYLKNYLEQTISHSI
jgi:hypothetical protein